MPQPSLLTLTRSEAKRLRSRNAAGEVCLAVITVTAADVEVEIALVEMAALVARAAEASSVTAAVVALMLAVVEVPEVPKVVVRLKQPNQNAPPTPRNGISYMIL